MRFPWQDSPNSDSLPVLIVETNQPPQAARFAREDVASLPRAAATLSRGAQATDLSHDPGVSLRDIDANEFQAACGKGLIQGADAATVKSMQGGGNMKPGQE